MRKVWIEVALNGAWSRRYQPGIPDTVDQIVAEGIACARAGASIVHTHAYENGKQTFDWQVYARIIEGIRAAVDVPVYPSYPTVEETGDGDAASRFAHIEALADRGLLDFAIVDPGSVNLTLAKTKPGAKPAATYLNPEAHVRHALDFAARKGLHPAFAIYEPGFTRAGAALARAAGVKPPVYRFMFSETFAFGFPPRPYALAAHLALLEDAAGIVALDDRRPGRRCPAADRRDRGPGRSCARRPRGCPFGHDDGQPRLGRGGRAAGARKRRRARNRSRCAARARHARTGVKIAFG